MNDWHTSSPYIQDLMERARQERADAMARTGYRLVSGVIDVADATSRVLLKAARGIIAGLRQWRERREATRSLLLLDDRMLKDVGLTRGEIWAAVHGRLPDRDAEAAPAQAAVPDIALSPHAIGGCNDNHSSRRAA